MKLLKLFVVLTLYGCQEAQEETVIEDAVEGIEQEKNFIT